MNVYFHTPEDFLTHCLKAFTPRNKSEECTICMETWSDDSSEAVAVPCHHHFHRTCIQEWIARGRGNYNSCPYCRETFFEPPADEKEEGSDDEGPTLSHSPEEVAAATELLFGNENAIIAQARMAWSHEQDRRRTEESDGTEIDWSSLLADASLAYKETAEGQMLEAFAKAESVAFKILCRELMGCARRARVDYSALGEILESIEQLDSEEE